MGRETEQTSLQKRLRDDQQIHEKVLNITNHQGNKNENQSDISPYSCQNDCPDKDER